MRKALELNDPPLEICMNQLCAASNVEKETATHAWQKEASGKATQHLLSYLTFLLGSNEEGRWGKKGGRAEQQHRDRNKVDVVPGINIPGLKIWDKYSSKVILVCQWHYHNGEERRDGRRSIRHYHNGEERRDGRRSISNEENNGEIWKQEQHR